MTIKKRSKNAVFPTVGPGVGILLGYRFTRRGEVFGCRSRINDENIVGEAAVDGGGETFDRHLSAIVKAGDLTFGMNAGIGA